MGWEALGHTKEEREPSERLCPSRVQAGSEAKTSHQPCPAGAPGGLVVLIHSHSPGGGVFGVEQGRL